MSCDRARRRCRFFLEPVLHDGIDRAGGTQMLSAVIMLCAVLVTAGIVSAGCFFWLVYRGPSQEEHAEMDSFGGLGKHRIAGHLYSAGRQRAAAKEKPRGRVRRTTFGVAFRNYLDLNG